MKDAAKSLLWRNLASLLMAFQPRDPGGPALTASRQEVASCKPCQAADFHVLCKRIVSENVCDRYKEGWLQRTREQKLIGIGAFLAHSCNYDLVPKLGRQRMIPARLHYFVGEKLGKCIRRRLDTLDYSDPEQRIRRVVCIEKVFFPGFVTGFNSADVGGGGSDHAGIEDSLLNSSASARSPTERLPAPFVLLLVNGGDMPITQKHFEYMKELPTMAACFAMNLHKDTSSTSALNVHPIPIGAIDVKSANKMWEEFIEIAREEALPWDKRRKKLLVTPAQKAGQLRSQFSKLFAEGGAYDDLVDVFTERVSPLEFARLISRYRAVLSPPGRGYDCFRTWQALSVGTVPLVVKVDIFDERLYEGTGAAYIPCPESLSPQILRDLLDGLEDPAEVHGEQNQIDFWKRTWESYL